MKSSVLELDDNCAVEHGDENLYLNADGKILTLNEDGLDSILNAIKIPVKYFGRVREVDATLAAKLMTLAIYDAEDVGVLVENNRVLRAVDARKMVLPVDLVQSTVAAHLNIKETDVIVIEVDDTYVGLFPTHKSVTFSSGTSAILYIRIEFSDCFAIVPRIDAMFMWDNGNSLIYPVRGRKLRIAGSSTTAVLNQIVEFVDLAVGQAINDFVPALNRYFTEWSDDYNVNREEFAKNLCTILRLKRSIGTDLIEGIEDGLRWPVFLVRLTAQLQPEVLPENMTLEMARGIEIAISNYITKGSFK